MKTKKNSLLGLTLMALFAVSLFASCSDNDSKSTYELKKEDISFPAATTQEVLKASAGTAVKIKTNSISDKGVSYKWFVTQFTPLTRTATEFKEEISTKKDLNYVFNTPGEYLLQLEATQGQLTFEYPYPETIEITFDEITPPSEEASPYITKVFDYLPAVGQFTNDLPKYQKGDTQEDMNQKVLAAIGGKGKGMISLGGFGGYVTVGFDHTIENVKGKRDFRVLGNAFYAAANPDPNAPIGGSCEPGVIMVAYDANKNGIPDENEWFEIAGSSHIDVTKEAWYDKAVKAGNDVKIIKDYEMTYFRPDSEPKDPNEQEYIRWEDNKGNSGFKVKNNFHTQPYFPQWVKEDKITLKGTRLAQNGIDESGQGNYFVLYKLRYGYADNELNNQDDSAIDIDWAIDKYGNKVHLPGVDFIKVYTGVDQENGWLGECSTEVTRIEDLHLLGIDIATREND